MNTKGHTLFIHSLLFHLKNKSSTSSSPEDVGARNFLEGAAYGTVHPIMRLSKGTVRPIRWSQDPSSSPFLISWSVETHASHGRAGPGVTASQPRRLQAQVSPFTARESEWRPAGVLWTLACLPPPCHHGDLSFAF